MCRHAWDLIACGGGVLHFDFLLSFPFFVNSVNIGKIPWKPCLNKQNTEEQIQAREAETFSHIFLWTLRPPRPRPRALDRCSVGRWERPEGKQKHPTGAWLSHPIPAVLTHQRWNNSDVTARLWERWERHAAFEPLMFPLGWRTPGICSPTLWT